MTEMEGKRMQRIAVLLVFVFCIGVLSFVVFMDHKSAQEQQEILEESIGSQLLAVCFAAREALDIDSYMKYTSTVAVGEDLDNYVALREEFRKIARNSGVDYIYVLRQLQGEYLFVMDSDPADEEIFIPYELSPVHEAAFAGYNKAGVMNVVDEYGSFNTGAVPIWKDGYVVGVICADIEDTYVQQSIESANTNTMLLVGVLAVVMMGMVVLVFVLMKRLRGMQNKLQRMAHYDTVTGLPNRQYLLEYLADLTTEKKVKPFALIFIDLDNFKAVNDNAGHDAGDELLRSIGTFLQESLAHSKAFRPTAGSLNVAARIGGDEFVQVVNDIATEEEAGKVAQGLLDRFAAEKFDRHVEEYKVGMSIGVALYPYHSDNYHVLIKYADIAMYHAKRGGKNTYRVYNDTMEAKQEK